MSRAVNERLCVVKKRFEKFSVLIGFGSTLILIGLLIMRKELTQTSFIKVNEGNNKALRVTPFSR